ncbi:MAG: hypothetical protein V7L20_24360 [Nostoc sp.]
MPCPYTRRYNFVLHPTKNGYTFIIAIASTLIPGTFHKDPADRILVAIAKRYV